VYQLNKKSFIAAISALFIALSAVYMVGCADNPDNKTSKNLRESTEKALTTASSGQDLEKARKQINSALKGNSRSNAASTANFTAANLTFQQAQTTATSLHDISKLINVRTADIQSQVNNIIDSQIELNKLENVKSGREKQIAQLTADLNGNSKKPGLRQQLKQANAKMASLQMDIEELVVIRDRAQNTASEIDVQAGEKARQAELLTGDEKLAKTTEGYDLLLSKKDYNTKIQAASDSISNLESQVQIVEPLIKKLDNDIERLTDKLNAINNSPDKALVKAHYSETKNLIDKLNDSLASLAAKLQNEDMQAWNDTAQKAFSLYEQAAEKYKKAKSSNISKVAGASLADTYHATASLYAETFRVYDHIIAQLEAMAASVEGQAAGILNKHIDASLDKAVEFAAKAIENYDLADEYYSKFTKSSSKDAFTCSAIRSHLLTLYGKINMATSSGKNDQAQAAQTKADELLVKAAECDAEFATSMAARLFDETADYDYTPSLTIDSTTYYTDMKAQFEKWKALSDADKEQEINRLLDMLNAMTNPRDPEEFARIIGPEKKLLEDALKKGFEFEEDSTSATMTTAPASDAPYDPNGFGF
jgi:hypothetical protein